MRLRAKIDACQPEIVAALVGVGCSVQTLGQVGRGCPDLLVYAPCGGYLLIEVKVPGEKLNATEAAWHARWKGPVHIVKSVEEALAVVGIEVPA
jgi:hypothetical protein